MRRCLNILQSSHAAHPTGITDATIHSTTGTPHPHEIDEMIRAMLNDDFTSTDENLRKTTVERGYALADIVSRVYETMNELEFPPHVTVYLLEALAEIEYRLAAGCSDKLQLGALVGAFKVALELAAKAL